MKKNFKRIIAAACAAVLAAGCMAGCGGGSGSSGDSNTIKVMFMGSEPVGWSDVMAKYDEIGPGVKLDVEWVTQGNMKDTLNLRLTAGEDYDLVFDAPFLKLKEFAADGIYTALEDYIASGDYPNLQAAYTDDVWKANYYYGHLYAIPNMRTYGNGIDCVYYRQDLADKYGIGQIDSYEKYQQFLDAILANEPNMIPLGVSASRGFYSLFGQDAVDFAKNHIVRISAGGFCHVLLNDEETEVKDIVYEGGTPEDYANFPEKYRDGQLFGQARFNKLVEWRKYLETDSLNQKDAGAIFKGGKAASMIDNLDSYEQTESDLADSLPDAKLGTFIINDAVRNMEPEARITSLQGNNFLCIPSTSKKIDATLKFLDWVFASKENHDLFELGIEGKDWTAVGDDKYSLPEDSQYTFPGYVLTWNPNFVRFSDELPEDIYEYKSYDLDTNGYYPSPLAGFIFDTSNIQTEMTKVNAIMSENSTALEHGALNDPVEVLRKANAEAEQNGREVIKEELKKQINEFLANKNAQ